MATFKYSIILRSTQRLHHVNIMYFAFFSPISFHGKALQQKIHILDAVWILFFWFKDEQMIFHTENIGIFF